jgi:hypothetical protein
MLPPLPPLPTPTGETAYTVKATGSSTSVSTLDAPDSPPLSLAQAAAQAATAAVLGAEQQVDMQASLRTGPMGGSNVLRADHSFSKDDHLFRVRGGLNSRQGLTWCSQGPIERISVTLCLLARRRQIDFDYIRLSRPLSGLTIHHSAPEEQQQKPQACAELNLQASPKLAPPAPLQFVRSPPTKSQSSQRVPAQIPKVQTICCC